MKIKFKRQKSSPKWPKMYTIATYIFNETGLFPVSGGADKGTFKFYLFIYQRKHPIFVGLERGYFFENLHP